MLFVNWTIQSFATDTHGLLSGYKKKKAEVAHEEAIHPGLNEAGLIAEVLLDHGPGLDPSQIQILHLLLLAHDLSPGLGQSPLLLRRP